MSTVVDPLATLPKPAAASTENTQADFKSSEPFVGLYTLWYREPARGNQIYSKAFRFNGPLMKARIRGERHCEIMRFKFMFVTPMITDLEKEEHNFLYPGTPYTHGHPAAAEEIKK